MRDYKSIQMLASISMIGGPVSLLFGGVPLSAAAVVCGIIALVMLRKGKERPNDEESPFSNEPAIAQNLMRQAIIGTAVSAVALVLNGAALASIMPAMLEAIQTGDYSSFWNAADPSASGSAFDGGSGSDMAAQSDPGSSSSIWG